MTDNQAQIAERAGAVATQAPASGGEVTVEDVLKVQEREIGRALPTGMTAERFARVVLTEVKRTPKLRKCTAHSLLGSVMLAAQLGLEPGPMQLSYLVPRWNKHAGALEAQFQIGYRGMIDLAMRSGQLLDIAAHVVYEADVFEFEYGNAPVLRHVPTPDQDKGKILWSYAVARTVTGGAPFEVLSVSDIEHRRARGAAADSGPWVTDWPAMARKTAVRALEPYLPRSVELAQAVRFDGAVVTDFTRQNIVETEPEPDDVIDVEGEEEGENTEGAGAPADSAATASEGASSQSDASTAADQDAPAPEGTKDAIAIGTARREVTSYRATKSAGATTAHRKLDEFLNDNGLDMDLENLDGEKAVAVIEFLAKNPIGRKRGDA